MNLGPSRKIVGQSVDFLVLGRGYLRPWKPPPAPLWPNPSYVPVPGYYFVTYGWMYLTAPPYALTRLKMNKYPIPTHQINVFNSVPLDLKRNSISMSLPAPNPGVLPTVPRQAFSVRMTGGKWPSTSPQLVETSASAALLPGAPQPYPTRHPRPSHQSTTDA